CAWSARTLRKSARVDSSEAAAIRSSTATGWPLEVMTKSFLPADLSHCFADFFFRSVTEIVLMSKEYAFAKSRASRAEAQRISTTDEHRCTRIRFAARERRERKIFNR